MEISDTPLNPIKVFLRSSAYTSCQHSSNKCQLFFELNKPIVCNPNIDIFCSLDSFNFTNSFYTINENNYKFIYLYNGNATFKFLTFGNYDIDSLVAHINTLIVSDNITITYNTVLHQHQISQIISEIQDV